MEFWSLWSNFLVYAAIMAVTPGPNNLLCLGNAGTFGFRASLPMLLGMTVSFVFLMSLCGFGTAFFGRFLPGIIPVLSVLGAAYILYIAYLLARSRGVGEGVSKACTFWQAFWFNCLNVKVLLYGLTSFSTYVLPVSSDFWTVVFGVLVLSGFGNGSNFLWALCGDLLRFAFDHYGRYINVVLALLLAYSALMMFV